MQDKVIPKASCKKGEHTFIITESIITSSRQKVLEMRCQHCLMHVSVEEIEQAEFKQREGIE